MKKTIAPAFAVFARAMIFLARSTAVVRQHLGGCRARHVN
ncbi:MAG: hypothetical protein JWO25_2841 [Alphaproteobacteria bacterium]|nr:hypothetical protein [Alphaproteobacteria bacterium]